jgi:hypothetical protein
MEQDDLQDVELVLGQGLRHRRERLERWLSSRERGKTKVRTESNGLGVFILPPTMVLEEPDLGNLVLTVLRDKTLDHHHFSNLLLNDTVFKEFAMLSMGGGKSEEWFHMLCKGMKEEEEKIFDETCQILIEDIWGCLRNSTVARKNPVETSHQ